MIGTNLSLFHAVSSSKISKATDAAMDRKSTGKATSAAFSVRHGPIDEDMDIGSPVVNGTSKRKSRNSTSNINYKDDSDSDGEPLVGCEVLRRSLTLTNLCDVG